MPKAAVLSSAVETAAKWPPRIAERGPTHPAAPSAALVIVSMVVKVFEATMNQRRFRVEPFSVSCDMRAVDVRDVMRARPVMIGRQRQRRHRRAKVRAADADVDHIGDPPP
jgi:hypothetical protein